MELLVVDWVEDGTSKRDNSWTVPLSKNKLARRKIISALSDVLERAKSVGCKFDQVTKSWRGKRVSVYATLVVIRGRKEVRITIDEQEYDRLVQSM